MRRTAPLVFFALMVLLAGGCSDDNDDDDGSNGPPITTVENLLVFRDADGQPIDFGPNDSTYIWCGPWASDVPVPALHVFVGTEVPPKGWRMMVVVDDIDLGDGVTFPNEFVFNQPHDAHIFVLDPPNELATNTEDSFGAITFTRLSCGTGGAVEFTIDATIGSEFGDGPSLTVTGSFRGPVGSPPSWYDDGN